MKMLAAMFYAPLDVRMEHQPVPQPNVGEVLLKVVAATTCGTDVKTYLRGHPLLIRKLPSRFGHEAAGFVAAIGPGVTQCAEGDAIVIDQVRKFVGAVGGAAVLDDSQPPRGNLFIDAMV